MASPDEARAAIEAARGELREAIGAAGGNWRVAPAVSGDGESWSAEAVAKHVIGAEIFFATAVCEACGYEGPANPVGEDPTLEGAEEALAVWSQVGEAADSTIRYVTAEDLERTHERMGTVAEVMATWQGHIREHAGQIRQAGGA